MITAAHCVVQKKNTKKDKYEVEIGVQDTRDSNNRRVYKVDSILIYPKYSQSKNKGIDHDLALIKLEDAVDWTDFAQPINLVEDNEIPATKALIVGWGSGQWNGEPTYKLNEAEMPIRDNGDCTRMLNTVKTGHVLSNGAIVTIKKGHLCAGYDEGGIDGCQVISQFLHLLNSMRFSLSIVQSLELSM